MQLSPAKARLAVRNGVKFLRELPRDWDITVARTSIHRFFYQMVIPYMTIYTRSLGAGATEIGLINSVGMAFAGLLGPFTGTLIDRLGPKKIYLFGIAMLVACWLTYALAQSWPVILIAQVAYWIGFETTTQGCSVVCARSLTKEKRATAMSLCETFAMGLLGLGGPALGGYLVTRAGGVSVENIRPLFYISAGGAVLSFILILTQLSNAGSSGGGARPGLLQGFSDVFKKGKGLKRFLIISSLAYLPNGMIIPYTQVYAREAKGADAGVLALMVGAFAIVPMVLGMPLGKLADKIGRKRVLYIAGPLFWLSNIMLILAPNSFFLVASGAFQGFFTIGAVISAAMTYEMVPKEIIPRWIGIQRFFRMLFASAAALLSGYLWDKVGLQYVFLAIIFLDAFIRIPLLISIPETLHSEKQA
jgi:MFS family permease